MAQAWVGSSGSSRARSWRRARAARQLVPDQDDGDDDAEWRAELVARYGTVRGFIGLLVAASTSARSRPARRCWPRHALPELIGRKRVDAEEVDADAGDGLVAAAGVRQPRAAGGRGRQGRVLFCVLEQLHRGAAPPGRVRQGRRPVGRPARQAAGRRAVGGRPAEGAQGARSGGRAGRAPRTRCRPRWTPPTGRSPPDRRANGRR